MTENRIVHSDLASLGYCNRGSREFFNRHGLNWSLFLKEGVEFSEVERIDDEMVRAVIRQAKRRIGVE